MSQNVVGSTLRWRDRKVGGDAPEDRAAALIRGSLEPGEPDPSSLAAIERRVSSKCRDRGLWEGRRPPALRFRLAVAGLVVLLCAGTVQAYRGIRHWGWLAPIFSHGSQSSQTLQPSQTPFNSSSPVSKGAVLPSAIADVPPIPTGATDRGPENDRVVERGPAIDNGIDQSRASHRAASVGGEPSQSRVPLEEIRQLDHAISLLRKDRDANGALAVLSAYFESFPRGVLGHEARLAQVDALLMLRRSDEALAALEKLPLDAHRRSTELRLIRAELRARSECLRANQDYGIVLARGPGALLEERALYGRAACRAKLGDSVGAEADVRRYLTRYPNGAHAAWARAWLESLH